MATIKITQNRSSIGQTKRQKETLVALGLNKIGRTVEHNPTPQIVGMVKKVLHLVSVEGELKAVDTKKKTPAKPKAEKKAETPKKKEAEKKAEAPAKEKKEKKEEVKAETKKEVKAEDKKEAKEVKAEAKEEKKSEE
jgi:large subunit ribosomal protein L30